MTQSTSDQLAPTMTEKDLRGFDRRRVQLIREMESYGWRGRRSKSNHAIMRAPDGETTASISPTVKGTGKNVHNVGQEFRTWLRQQEQIQAQMTYPTADAISVLVAMTAKAPAGTATEDRSNGNRRPLKRSEPAAEVVVVEPEAPVDTAVLPVAQHATPEAPAAEKPAYRCEECDRDFAGAQPLSVHHVRVHVKVECQICERPMAPGNLPRHVRKHVQQLGTHEEVMREVLRLRAELARARDEATEWERMADEIEDRYTAIKTQMDSAVEILTAR